MQRAKSGVVKAVISILLCAPEFLSLMPALIGFNAYSKSVVVTPILLCFVVSIGLAISCVRKGNDAAWAMGFLTLGLHVSFLAKLLTPPPGAL